MMLTRTRRWLLAGVSLAIFAVLAALFIRDAGSVRPPEALPLTHTFDQSSGFSVQYPDDWDYTIPDIGLMVLAPNEVMHGGQPGPSITIQRAEPLSVVGTLDGAMDRYLRNGPMHAAGQWQITNPVQPIQFGQRDARTVELQSLEAHPQHSRVIVTNAANTFVYLFVTTVPVDKQAAYEPTFAAILASVRILE